MTEKTGQRTVDELLGAFIDGELDAAEAAALTARLASEPELAARLEALRGADSAVRELYAQLDRTPLPDSVLGLFDTGNVVRFPERGIRRFLEAPVAIAASVALVAGFLAATLLRPNAIPADGADALVAGSVSPGSGLYRLLESTPSGEPVAVAGAVAEVVLTFEGADGNWCRQLLVEGSGRPVHGVACRDESGWQLEALALGTATSGGAPFGVAAADIPEAVEATVDTLIGGNEVLDADNEKRLITGDWKKIEK